MKRKRLAAATKPQDGYPVAMQSAFIPQVAQPSISITNPMTYPAPDYGQNQGLKSFERVREMSSSAVPGESNRNAGEVKKKRRKPENDFVDSQGNPQKAPLQHVSEKKKPSKPSDEANAGSLPVMVATETVLGLPITLGHNQQPNWLFWHEIGYIIILIGLFELLWRKKAFSCEVLILNSEDMINHLYFSSMK
jgi:hypothetical protein